MNEVIDGDTLREGIFALHTRRFGSVAEVLIKRLGKLCKSKTQFHDLFCDVTQKRVEVKFSRAMKASEVLISENTVLECIKSATGEEKMIPFVKWEEFTFDCNIQQIKRTEFDILYYGVFFADCVKIFRIDSSAIGSQIYYSDKQHKGNVGEGQFHINNNSLKIHLDKYLYKTLTYDELGALLSQSPE